METTYSNDPLLLNLYRCCTAPGEWQTVLDRLCDEVGAHSAVMQAIAFADGHQGRTYWCAHDSRTDVQAYQALISDADNPRMDRRRGLPVIGRFVGDEKLFTGREDFRQQQRLQRQLADLGFGRFLGALLPIGGDRFMAMVLHRPVGNDTAFGDAERQRLAGLLPHFGQAAELSQSLHSERKLEQILSACLDRWQCGLVICDADGRVQWMNRPARDRIARDGVPHLRDGTLRAHGDKDALLRHALMPRSIAHGRATFLTLDHAYRQLHLAVQPLTRADGIADAGGALVMISDGNLAGEIPAAALAALFDLTEAEARLASALVQGDTLEQYAQRRGVSIGTVRYQLKQVLSKTGTNRQSELMRKVLCSAAAHAAGFQSAAAGMH
ncbi:helix-turn-helix transcriptional regulator [Ralstonia solanacearum]|uniref:helix-turn-helix transcriptional regulator n=1 Tax=Ralstonia solanacearum TaxID=305 RepID=UPI000F61550B|nr:helix-turn-helix transcriptional regulator [Ralstonia solanacearum]MCL9844309.1 helix-turn-helix transcriptional regulator [Ralstonia solanacearum]MDC6256270.1 helix-turn-helix transcriptional regulator [Ralstonia solanacearum]MDC6260858.1 helix-turn-helix transcriptional regulator [Ralstonia solanacearum]MDC6303685.1 helix-turn-helix transcriptional regulator [Ralstonia solanacearum]